ncbi:MAG: hypothetical protein ACWA41_03180 [Putridiphycobacter sp.]
MLNENSENSKVKKSYFPISINDLRDKYYDGEQLTEDQLLAIQNFDKYRIDYLNASEDEEEFDKRYLELQAKANLADYKEFLD